MSGQARRTRFRADDRLSAASTPRQCRDRDADSFRSSPRSRRRVVGRGLVRHGGKRIEPGELGFHSGCIGGWHALRLVEGAGCQLDDGAADLAIAERRAAPGAEVAHGARGRLESRRPAAGPGELVPWHLRQHHERPSHRLLAHAAVADAGLDRLGIDREPHRAALAAARVMGRALQTHSNHPFLRSAGTASGETENKPFFCPIVRCIETLR